MITATDYFATARRLLSVQPTETDIRRAVSTAYYALFHHLCGQFSGIVLRQSDVNYTQAWLQAYRYVDHGPAKNTCLEAKDPK